MVEYGLESVEISRFWWFRLEAKLGLDCQLFFYLSKFDCQLFFSCQNPIRNCFFLSIFESECFFFSVKILLSTISSVKIQLESTYCTPLASLLIPFQ